MPLHLLGKKSWNVYNPANVERVQRDEAEAQKREQEEERRQRQDEASDRIAILRGERDHTLPESGNEKSLTQDSKRHNDQDPSSKRRALKTRKLPGEDDTDRDIRLAQAQAETQQQGPSSLSEGHKVSSKPDKSQDHSITDADGHISLIPNHAQSDQHQHKRQKPDENPAHFYLSEAAGHGSKAGDVPWYSSGNKDPSSTTGTKEPWGLTSPRRKERQAARLSSNDPLAAMKRGVKQLRDSERQRKEWKEQRERDLGEVEELARRREEQKRRKRRRPRDADDADQRTPARTSRRRERQVESRSKPRGAGDAEADDSDANSLDGFDLDQGYAKPPEKERQSRTDSDGHRHRHHHHHHRHHDRSHRSHHSNHHHRHRSRSRSPRRE